MDIVFILGITAGTMTTVSFLPQLIKAHKTRHTGDLSLLMLIMLFTGIGIWTVYGFLISEIPVIASNSVSFLMIGYILLLKIRYG